MKHVSIGNTSFSMLIFGSNAFRGRSHTSEARDSEYLERFDDDTIGRTIGRYLGLGINTAESCGNERILTVLSRLNKACWRYSMIAVHFNEPAACQIVRLMAAALVELSVCRIST